MEALPSTPSAGVPLFDDRPVDEDVLMQLAQVLAHRIRSLVAGIEGFTDLLTDTLHTREQRETALRILEGTARIERVLTDLQCYGQWVAPVTLPLTVADVTDELLVVLDDAARERVQVAAPGRAEMTMPGDPFLLRQALLVLLQNALEATKGKVCLTVHATPAVVRFDIHNEGVIPLEDAERQVFTPFFTTKAQNLGVGLSIARRIAEAHGGHIALAANDPVLGTIFRMDLPRVDDV